MSSQPIIGQLDLVPLPLVVQQCYLRKASGVLDLHQDTDHRRVFLLDGEVRSARSNRMEQKIGQYTVRSGALTNEQLERALAAESHGVPLGQRLVAMGFLTEDALNQHLQDLVREILFECFGWESGEYRFYEGKPKLPEELEIAVSTADIVFHGFRRFGTEEIADRILGDRKALVIPNPNLRLLYQHVSLDPAEGFMLTRINGTESVQQILDMLPGDPHESLITLAAFIACGLATLQRTPAKTRRPGSFPQAAAAHNADGSGGAPAAAGRRKRLFKTKKPTEAKLSQEDVNLIREAVLEKFRRLADLNYYELLDLPFRATQKEVHYAFQYMGYYFHPDLARKPEFRDLKRELEAVFAKLEQAYDTLINHERRKKYNRSLGYR